MRILPTPQSFWEVQRFPLQLAALQWKKKAVFDADHLSRSSQVHWSVEATNNNLNNLIELCQNHLNCSFKNVSCWQIRFKKYIFIYLSCLYSILIISSENVSTCRVDCDWLYWKWSCVNTNLIRCKLRWDKPIAVIQRLLFVEQSKLCKKKKVRLQNWLWIIICIENDEKLRDCGRTVECVCYRGQEWVINHSSSPAVGDLLLKHLERSTQPPLPTNYC